MQDLDRYIGAQYNGYDDIDDFYREMSSFLPYESDHSHIAIPHLVLQAFDDPVSTWRSNAADDPKDLLYPTNFVQEQENVFILLTQRGGHVGWPIGWWPTSWEYMNTLVASGFIDAYVKVQSGHQPESSQRVEELKVPSRRSEETINPNQTQMNGFMGRRTIVSRLYCQAQLVETSEP